jgi:ribonuclease VapC
VIVIDTSAVIAIFLDEPEHARCMTAIVEADAALLPAPAYVECSMVLGGRAGETGLKWLDAFIETQGIRISALTERHAKIAQAAFMTYGKGRHPAGLNFGDCMSYAVAKAGGWPLLYVGGDFGLTDVAV